MIVHWDGKLFADLTGKQDVDHLAILVSCQAETQLLCSPKLPSGTGEAQASAVCDANKQWGLGKNIQAMCFDTTSSNTGRTNGSRVIVEQKLGRDLLRLACRHHIMELIAGAAFKKAMSATSAPQVLLVKRFKEKWELIDKDRYEDSSTDEKAAKGVNDIKDELIRFIHTVLEQDKQPRDGYRELMEITLIFLGDITQKPIRFRAPGASHHARWMAKVIYTFKVWLFRSQFRMTHREQNGLRDLCIFYARIYVKNWISAPLAIKAPYNDWHLYKDLEAYRQCCNESTH